MCGIVAVIGEATKEEVAILSSRMRHRGPDEREVVQTKLGVLSHERLAIVDLKTGRQPIQGTRNNWLIHNGEIYNYRELYSSVLKDFKRRTTSDSESIIHLYELKQDALCNELDGMFAFIIIDEDQKTFMAARDPLGVKPLYWGTDKKGRMWFASEMKVIHDIVIEASTFPPGHFYTPEKGLVKYHKPEWETKPATRNNLTGLREKLESAVEKRMHCDVPFGVLLSGGLDSSLIASIVARKLKGSKNKLHSFSIGTHRDAPDLKAARMVADFLNTEHHEVLFSIEDGIAALEKIIWHLESYDVTTLRASTPMYFLSKYIKEQGIKMVLSGEGADEVFGGYLYFFNAPDDLSFTEETKRRVNLLHTADLLRADKSTMAWGLEARVPMLDKAFLETAMRLSPEVKRPIRDEEGVVRIEKWALRKAFDDKENPYLPSEILWRQKEQFSDGVGYNWIDAMIAFCESQVSDFEFSMAAEKFPFQTPATKEAYYIRKKFHQFFPEEACAKTVYRWIPKWQKNADPSGRANNVHSKTTEKEILTAF